MSEKITPGPGGHENGVEENPETTIEQIGKVFEKWSAQTSRDRRIRAISGAVHIALAENNMFRRAVDFMVDFHEDPDMNVNRAAEERQSEIAQTPRDRWLPHRISPLPSPEYGANLIIRGLQHEWLEIEPELDYPQSFTTIDKCLEGIAVITTRPELYDNFENNIAWRPIQTNYPNREIGPKAVLLHHQDRFSGPINFLDVGHSLGLGVKKLLLNEPFMSSRVMEWHEYSEYSTIDWTLSRNFDDNLNTPLSFKNCIGIDIMPGDKDPAYEKWIRRSFYPKEFLDKKLMAEVDHLTESKPDNYYSVQGDFANPTHLDEIKAIIGADKLDVISFITIMHQLTEEDRDAMFENALELLAPGGLIIVQDFVRKGTDETLYFPREWKPYTYRTLVYDPHNSEMEPKETMFFKDGRCQELRLSDEYRDLLL